MENRIFHRDSAIAPENQNYLERPRINKLLSEAILSPIVTVSAGAGYGKTQAVYSFLRKYDRPTMWIQLSERDNLNTRFWENCVGTAELSNKRFAERLREMGFPETDDQFAKYLSIADEETPPGKKNRIVIDDLHLIKDRSVLQFIQKSMFMNRTRMSILISRAEPDINIIGLLSKGLVVSINEDDLRFTPEETAQYFQMLGIPLSSQSISDIYSDTAGWPFALRLIGLALKKAPHREQAARVSMKLNVFRMIENEVFLAASERLRRFLIRLSLIDHLSTDLVSILAGDEALVDEVEKINSFVHRDLYTGAYLIHHLFLDYLRQKQQILTEEEKRGTYLKAARWCDENDYKMDAVSYYSKAGDYEAIVETVYRLPVQIPFNEAKFILDIYDSAPADALERIASYHRQRARLLMSVGRYSEAIADARARAERYSALPESDFKNRVLCGVYTALGIMSFLTLPHTDRCDFDVLLEKADHYYRLSPSEDFGSVTSVSLDAWASKVGTARSGAMEEYIETLTRAIPHAVAALNGFMYGLDDLARGELLFYKGDLKMAEKFLRQALHKAETRNQYETRNRSLFYLLRVGAAQGDFGKIQETHKLLEAQLGMRGDFARYVSYDIVSSWYYSLLGQPQLVADWLKGDFAQVSLGIHQTNFRNFIKAKFHYANKQYHELLSFLELDRTPYLVLFGKLEMKVLEAACKYQIKNKGASLLALKEAYDLALSNGLTMPFIELGKDMRTLTAAAMREKNCDIPRSWLEVINRKAATYAKRLAFVVSEYRKANNLDAEYNVPLSEREMDVLNGLWQGLSRAEIAAAHDLSINTVKMVLSSIYTKLGADSVADVIRIALSRKLIKQKIPAN